MKQNSTPAEEVLFFAQALPADNKGSSADLLRWVAQTLDTLGEVELLDISYEKLFKDDDQPMLSVFYKYKEGAAIPSAAQKHRIKQTSILADPNSDAEQLFSVAAKKAETLSLALNDLSGLSLRTCLDKDKNEKTVLTIYY